MSSKIKGVGLKGRLSSRDAAQGQSLKTSKRTERSSREDEEPSDEEEEEDALEMERNFELYSQRNSSLGVKMKEAVSSGSDDEEEIEDDDDDDDDDPEKSDDQDTLNKEEIPESSGDVPDSEDCDSDDDDDDDEGEGTSTRSNTVLQTELSTMSFEEIMRLQSKVGTKAYNKIAYDTTKNRSSANLQKPLNKHRPEEISSKKPVPFLRKVVPVKKPVSRDPRFDDLSGDFRPEVFSQTYRFIDDIRQRETQMVKKKLKKVQSDSKREELRALMKRMENQERARRRLEQQREKELQLKKKQRELVEQGHRPFYLKKSDKKKLELAEKYKELKKSGKLENFLSKKRKRNAIKDRRKLPHQHKTN